MENIAIISLFGLINLLMLFNIIYFLVISILVISKWKD